jgi:pimeloyl-ACP methyl ester carboxylesterase
MSVRILGPVFVLALTVSTACGSGGDAGVTPELARLFGEVTDEDNRPVSGALVAIADVSTTSDPAGRFELPSVPVGPAVPLSVTAAGHDPVTTSLRISSGTNVRRIRLARANTMFDVDGFLVYVPPEVAIVHGVFLHMYGDGVDSRPMIRGNLEYYEAFPLAGNVSSYRAALMTFARTHEFAVMGGTFTGAHQTPVTYDGILAALVSASAASARPQLATAPLLLNGSSRGGCIAYEFAVTHPARTIGFISTKAPCLGLDGAPAAPVPGYFVLGELDPVTPPAEAARIVGVFEENRARGALWAFAVEPGAVHGVFADHELLLRWAAEVAANRLPGIATAGAPVELRTLDEESGWLADRSSFRIGEFDCYDGIRAEAGWLPSERTARDWQSMVSRGVVDSVILCDG